MLVYQKVEFSCFHLFFFYIFFCHGKFEVGNAEIILESEPLERNASHILRLYKHYEKHRKTNTKEHLVLKNIENKGIASRESFQETLVFALP